MVHIRLRRFVMSWQTPSFADIRFGFEVTMYIANR
jgi:coenzyme PQQ precursor peptide PqqA